MASVQRVRIGRSQLVTILSGAAIAGLVLSTLTAGGGLPLILASVAIIGLVTLNERPVLGLYVVIFVFYINLLPVLARYHEVNPAVAIALPALLLTPLLIRVALDRSRPLGSHIVRVDAVFGLMAAFLGVLVVSSLAAEDIDAAFRWTADYIFSGLIVYIVVLNAVRDERMLRYVIWAMLAAGAFLAAVTIGQEVTHTYANAYGGFSPMLGSFLDGESQLWRSRPSGPVADPNRYAQLLLVLVPLGLFRARAERGRLRLLAAGMSLAIIGAVILTYSRGAGVALLLLLPIIAWQLRIRVRYLVGGAVALAVAVLIVFPGFVDRMETVRELTTALSSDTQTEADRSMRSRLTKNLAALHMYFDHPVLGVGPDNYGVHSAAYADPVGKSVNVVGSKAHNLYLGLLAETGTLGFAAFMAAGGVSVVRLVSLRNRYEGTERSDVATALLLAIAAYALSAMFLHLSFQRYFWMLPALGGALVAIAREEERLAATVKCRLPWASALSQDRRSLQAPEHQPPSPS